MQYMIVCYIINVTLSLLHVDKLSTQLTLGRKGSYQTGLRLKWVVLEHRFQNASSGDGWSAMKCG